jgi:hypothetical protein
MAATEGLEGKKSRVGADFRPRKAEETFANYIIFNS